MLEVYGLVIGVVFSLAAAVVVFLTAVHQIIQYAKARRVMQRILASPKRDRVIVHSTAVQNEKVDVLRAA